MATTTEWLLGTVSASGAPVPGDFPLSQTTLVAVRNTGPASPHRSYVALSEITPSGVDNVRVIVKSGEVGISDQRMYSVVCTSVVTGRSFVMGYSTSPKLATFALRSFIFDDFGNAVSTDSFNVGYHNVTFSQSSITTFDVNRSLGSLTVSKYAMANGLAGALQATRSFPITEDESAGTWVLGLLAENGNSIPFDISVEGATVASAANGLSSEAILAMDLVHLDTTPPQSFISQGGTQMSFFSSLIDSIVDFVKGLWDMLGPLLVIAIIVFIVCAPYLVTVLGTGSLFAAALPTWLAWLPTLVTAAASWGPLGAALGGFGLAYMIDPSSTTDIVGNVAEGVGTVIGTAAGAVASGVSSASGLMSWVLIGGAAFIAYKVITSYRDDDDDDTKSSSRSTPNPRAVGATNNSNVRIDQIRRRVEA